MQVKDISTTFHTDKIAECKEFYIKYLNARLTFDHSWYVAVRFESAPEHYFAVCFMEPEYGHEGKCSNGGVTLNIMVADVDAEYARIKALGAEFTEDIADHDWGDRAFSILDPIGNVLYIYSERAMTDEYQAAVRE